MVRAHEKWVAAGRPKGDGSHFWLEAERELLQEAAQTAGIERIENHIEVPPACASSPSFSIVEAGQEPSLA
jgi:hypothetical protein